MEEVKQDEGRVRKAALRLLMIMQRREVLPALIDLGVQGVVRFSEFSLLAHWSGVVELLVGYVTELGGAEGAFALEVASQIAGDQDVSEETMLRLRSCFREGLQSDDVCVREASAQVAASWADLTDVPLLAKVASSFDSESFAAMVCSDVLSRLADSDPEAVRASLAPVRLDEPSSSALTGVVAKVSGDQALRNLRVAFSSESETLRRAAVEALEDLADHRLLEILTLGARDTSVQVRSATARVAGRLRSSSGKPVVSLLLNRLLTDANNSVRAEAIGSVALLGDRSSLPTLRECLSATSPDVIVAAVEALKLLGDEELRAAISAQLERAPAPSVRMMLRAIASVGEGEFVEEIATSLAHDDWEIRQCAARLLRDLDAVPAMDALKVQRSREKHTVVAAEIERSLEHLARVRVQERRG